MSRSEVFSSLGLRLAEMGVETAIFQRFVVVDLKGTLRWVEVVRWMLRLGVVWLMSLDCPEK